VLKTIISSTLIALAMQAHGESVSPSGFGVIDSRGVAYPATEAFVGVLDNGTEVNTWYSFDIPVTMSPIIQASISFSASSFFNDHSYTLYFSDVLTGASMLATQVPGADAFLDLQTGASFGSVPVTNGEYVLNLPPDDLKGSIANPNQFIIGVSNAVLPAPSSGGVFDLGTILSSLKLNYTIAAVPEPHAGALFILGLAAIASLSGKRKHT
jgi:hypothetical protein